MLNSLGTALIPSVEGLRFGNVESITAQLAQSLAARTIDETSIVTNEGEGGMMISSLDFGSTAYIRLTQVITNIDTLADNATPIGVVFLHGQADEEAETPTATYRVQLEALLDDLRDATGNYRLVMYLVPPGAARSSNHDYQLVTAAMVETYRARPMDFRIVTPEWIATYIADQIHPDQAGYALLGKKIAQAVHHERSKGIWPTFLPTSVRAEGDRIVLDYTGHVHTPPIQISQPAGWASKTDGGFRYVDTSSSPPIIEGVVASGITEVTLNLSHPARTTAHVEYGNWANAVSTKGAGHDASTKVFGYLRDSSDDVSGPNYAIGFGDPVSESWAISGAVSPPVSIATGYVNFDNGESIGVPDSPLLDLPTTELTLSFWYRATTIDHNDVVVDRWEGSDRPYRVATWTNGAVDSFFFYVNDQVTGTRSLFDLPQMTDGAWHQYVFVYNGSSPLKMYVDGDEVAGYAPAGTPPSSLPASAAMLRFGRETGVGPVTLDLTQVALWPKALDKGDVREISGVPQTLYPSTFDAGDPVGWWRLNNLDSPGTGTILDLGPNALHGDTLDGMTQDDFVAGAVP